jgi:hypothetical protein
LDFYYRLNRTQYLRTNHGINLKCAEMPVIIRTTWPRYSPESLLNCSRNECCDGRELNRNQTVASLPWALHLIGLPPPRFTHLRLATLLAAGWLAAPSGRPSAVT